ncbi:MAG: hypothetical protein ABI778_06820, partial [Ignavibacteriota bacterium]
MLNRYFFIAFIFSTGIIGTAKSQYLSDAVRLANQPLGTGARTLAMGGTGIATANDYSALDWNPAALTLIEASEINLSLYFRGHNSTSTFFNSATDESLTNTALSSIGYISAVPTTRGHLAYGLSYDRVLDYNSSYSFKAINPNSSFFNTTGFINEPQFSRNETFADYLSDLGRNNLAWQLYLTNYISDTLHPKLTTPFGGGLQQSGMVTDEGGMNAFRFGGGIDIAEHIALGGTINAFIGKFDQRKVYTEEDINNVLPNPDSLPPNGFKSATIIDNRHQSQTGFSFKLGLLATPSEMWHFGFTFETPGIYAIEDQFQRTGSSVFKNGQKYNSLSEQQNPDVGALNVTIVNNYTVTTPMKFGAGVAFASSGLTISGAADFSDPS